MHQIDNQFLRSHYAKQERKIIRKSGNIIGGIILAALLFIDIIGGIIGEVIAALSEYYIIDYTLTSYTLQIVLSAILFVLPFFIMAKVSSESKCSIRQASSSAAVAETPFFSKYSRITQCFSYTLSAYSFPFGVRYKCLPSS